jgi:hypothetical protein
MEINGLEVRLQRREHGSNWKKLARDWTNLVGTTTRNDRGQYMMKTRCGEEALCQVFLTKVLVEHCTNAYWKCVVDEIFSSTFSDTVLDNGNKE